MLDKTNKFFYV